MFEKIAALGFSVLSPEANMILAELPSHMGDTSLFAAAMERQGITVLEGKVFSPTLKRYVRISPRTRKLNMAFLAAVREKL